MNNNEKKSKKPLAKLLLSIGLIVTCAGTIGVGTYSWIRREWTPSIVGEDVKITAGSSLMFVLNNESAVDTASLVSLLGPSYKDFVLKPVSNKDGKTGKFYKVNYTSGEEDATYELIQGSSTAVAADNGYIEFNFSIKVTSKEFNQYIYLNPKSRIESSTLQASQSMRVSISWGNEVGSEDTTHIFRNQCRVTKAEGDYTEDDIGKYQYTYNDGSEDIITLNKFRTVGSETVENEPYIYHYGITPIEVDDGFGGSIIDNPDGKPYLDEDGNVETKYTKENDCDLFSNYFGGVYKENEDVRYETVTQDEAEITYYYIAIPNSVGDGSGSTFANSYIKDANGNLIIEEKATLEEVEAFHENRYYQTNNGIITQSFDDKFYSCAGSEGNYTFTESDTGNYIRCEDATYCSCDGKYYMKDESVTKANDDQVLFIAPKGGTVTFNVTCKIWLEGCDPNCDSMIKDKLIDLILMFDMFEDKEL